jgi:hypothetical protein
MEQSGHATKPITDHGNDRRRLLHVLPDETQRQYMTEYSQSERSLLQTGNLASTAIEIGIAFGAPGILQYPVR